VSLSDTVYKSASIEAWYYRRKLFMNLRTFIVPTALAFLLVGCGGNAQNRAMAILDNAASYELLSLDPCESNEHPESMPIYLRMAWVLGKITVKDDVTKKKLNDALRRVDSPPGAPVSCFNPRHAIRTKKDGRTYDVVICFECNSVKFYIDERYAGEFQPPSEAQPLLNEVLTSAGIPLAKTSE
jgi:hypothetical protein